MPRAKSPIPVRYFVRGDDGSTPQHNETRPVFCPIFCPTTVKGAAPAKVFTLAAVSTAPSLSQALNARAPELNGPDNSQVALGDTQCVSGAKQTPHN